MIKPIHPFPARMAPELAIRALAEVRSGGIVLDPMVGSGTVVREASDLGLRGIGFDTDPLAVLMTKVWTTPVDDDAIARMAANVVDAARLQTASKVALPWIDDDKETTQFIEFWFGEAQRDDLRRIASVLGSMEPHQLSATAHPVANVLRIALSRIIITKDSGASLGRDISHSRPHKVKDHSAYEVFPAFEQSVKRVRQLLAISPPRCDVTVRLGDSRRMSTVPSRSVDAVLTSPPYLNAIDYIRGHRLSLVWLGYRLSELRNIRASSIGAERGRSGSRSTHLFDNIQAAMGSVDNLPPRYESIVSRYVDDIYRLMSEIARVLKPQGRATLVVGNSCLKGVFIRNADGFATAGEIVGMTVLNSVERELPNHKRYLPVSAPGTGPLSRRMRTETVLTLSS